MATRTPNEKAADAKRREAAKNQGLGKNAKGGPIGNNNTGEATSIKDAIRYVMTNYERGEVQRGQALKAIVQRAVDDALDGDKAARDWLSERLEGKSAQSLVVSGDENSPLRMITKVELVPLLK